MEHLKRAALVLASLKINQSVRFYRNTPGFIKTTFRDENYTVIGHVRHEYSWCNAAQQML